MSDTELPLLCDDAAPLLCDDTVPLLHLLYDDAASAALMACLDLRDAWKARAAHPQLRDAVAAYAWHDTENGFTKRRYHTQHLYVFEWEEALRAWQTCFPRARVLNMNGWVRDRMSGAAFMTLGHISTLNLRSNRCIRDDIFAHLPALVDLDTSCCENLTTAAFKHLKALRSLKIRSCLGVEDAAFANMTKLEYLDVSQCSQLTDAAFARLFRLRRFILRHCNQRGITNAAIEHMTELECLDISNCTQMTDDAFRHLGKLRRLRIDCCVKMTDAVFKHLPYLVELDIGGCKQLSDAAFACMTNLVWLSMWDCTQMTRHAFTHLERLEWVFMLLAWNAMGYVRVPNAEWVAFTTLISATELSTPPKQLYSKAVEDIYYTNDTRYFVFDGSTDSDLAFAARRAAHAHARDWGYT